MPSCPNKQPTVPPDPRHRLAIVGSSPSSEDCVAGEPFSDSAGRFLRGHLANLGVATSRLFFGNVAQTHHAFPDNLNLTTPQAVEEKQNLTRDLEQFAPNTILLLGKLAFRSFRGDLCYNEGSDYHTPLSDWRGSIFCFNPPCIPTVLATYHPGTILRSYNDFPFFKFDLARAVRLSGLTTYTPRFASGNLRPTIQDVRDFFFTTRQLHRPTTLDIEGYPDITGVTMVSFVPTENPATGLVIPFRLGGHYWTEDEETEIWKILADFLQDDTIEKTCHNCFYELFVFAWRHRCVINNVRDTMFSHWELYPEFAGGDKEERQKVSATQKKRSLGICASLYTEQPFYKDDRLSDNQDVKLNYNFLDSSVTAEVANVTKKSLSARPASLAHYEFNTSLIPPFTYTMLRGCKFDANKARALIDETTKEITHFNLLINQELEKRNAFSLFPVSKEKDRETEGFNVKSSKQKCWLLYDYLKYKPLQKWGRTGDEDALLHYWKKDQDHLLRLIIQAVRKRTRLSDIHKLIPDIDGRIRCAYDIVGTNTGRISSRKSMSLILDADGNWINTGTNFQNQTKDLRICYIPDGEEFLFWQCDLSGADAWTVAAELAALGYPAMFDDLKFGIKPSLVLYHMITEHAAGRDVRLVNSLSRPQIKQICNDIKSYLSSAAGKNDSSGRPLDWLYLCCKRVQHGSNYDMQAERTTELVFGDSDGNVVLSKKDAELYQSFYKLRYQTDKRNDWIRKTLSETSCVVTSCGVRRQFFGIRNHRDIDDSIVREASAVNPQCNTTYLTNLALKNLWYDGKNRKTSGSLHIEPLIQVHDALAGQCRIRDREFTGERLTHYFANPLRIANTVLTIPFEGAFGPNWKDTKDAF